MSKKLKMPKMSKDEIRELILKYLYNIHKKARSLKSARKKISEIKEELKKYGLKEQDIISNLDYLIQCGWVKSEEEIIHFKTPKGFTKEQKKQYFKISDAGISYFEGTSKFQKIEKTYSGININNVQGVINIGDNNIIVNEQHADLYKNLDLLSKVIRSSDKLTDEEKLNYVSEIETIKAQLSKTNPDRNIIKRAWKRMKPLATISGIASFFEKTSKLVSILLNVSF